MKTYSDCQEVRDEFSALLDDELGPDEREGVEAHLSQCAQCLRELDGLKNVDTLYRRLPFVNAPEGFEEGIRDALNPTLPFRLRKRPFRGAIYGSLAAAALLLIVAGLTTLWLPDSTQRFNMAQNTEVESLAVGGPLEAQRPELPRDASESEFAAQEPVRAAKELAKDAKGKRLEADRAAAPDNLNKVESLGYVEDDASRARKRVVAASPATPESPPPAPSPAVALTTLDKSAVSAGPTVSAGFRDSAKPDALAEQEPPRAAPMPKRSARRAPSEEVELDTLRVESDGEAGIGGMASGLELGDARSDAVVNDMNFGTGASEDLDERRTPEVSQIFAAPEEEKVSDSRKKEDVFFQKTPDDRPAPPAALPAPAGEYERNERAADIKRSPAAPAERATVQRRTVTGVSVKRSFDKRDGVWYQTGYNRQPLTELKRDSKQLRTLIAQHREINDYLNWKERVIFRIDRKWYALKAQKP